jgi:hypothetical protein
LATQRPRVLILIKGLGRGGAERLIAEGARFWNRDDFDYRVAYLLPWKDHLVADLEALGVPVDCIGGRRGIGLGTIARTRASAIDGRVGSPGWKGSGGLHRTQRRGFV